MKTPKMIEKKLDSSTNELKKNESIKYLPKNSTEWKETRGGKATEKYKGYWNTQENENAPLKCIGFDRDIEALEILDEPSIETLLKICQKICKREKSICYKFHTLNKKQNRKS